MKGSSPFKADRTHLHHYLLDMGFTHSNAVTILLIANILIIIISLVTQDYNPNIAILCILLVSMALFGTLYYMRKNKLARIKAAVENNAPPIASKGNIKELPVNIKDKASSK